MVETTRRREIEDAASSLFHERGYAARASATSPARSTSRAPACTPTSRRSRTSCGRSSSGTAARFEAAADAVEAADPGALVFGPGVHLISLVRAHVGVVTDDIERASVFVHEWRALEPRPPRRHRASGATPTRRRFRTAIADGVEAGAFAPVDPAAAAAFILTALNGLVAWYRPDGRLSARTHRRRLRRPRAPRRPAPAGRPMTDPLALEPDPRPAASEPRPAFNDDAAARRALRACSRPTSPAGGKVEATDWMPDEYRTAVLRFVEMHANSELMGVLPEREWLMRAPTLRRKLALTAKVQDEVGHAQLLYRVAEDLGKSREAMFDDLLAGKTKFHNVFHYPTRGWADVGMIAWLVDAAAIVAQQALRDSSYAPYARTMRKICWEESVHIMHGRDVVVTMVDRDAGPARGDPGRARPLVGPADADARPALAAREGPRPALADQGQDLRGAAPGVPDHLRAADPRARAGHPGPGAALRRGDRRVALHASPTGTSCGRSSPTTARCRRRGSSSGGSPARRRAGSATRSSGVAAAA